MYEFALGFLVCTDLVLLGAAYLWVYRPWKIVRTDQTALFKKFQELEDKVVAELQLRKVINKSDSDLARLENTGTIRRWLREAEHV